MAEAPRTVLVMGFGNPGRLDDGLGPALAAALEGSVPAGVTVDADYQLTVEDAAALAAHDVVIFADAAVDGPEPFSFERLRPEPVLGFSSHSVRPAALLALAETLFGAGPATYVLGIRGYEFNEFGERLSAAAQANLTAAAAFVRALLQQGNYEAMAAAHPRACGAAETS